MNRSSSLSAIAFALGAALFCWAALGPDEGAAAGPLLRRGIIPGIAADSAPAATPTTVPSASPTAAPTSILQDAFAVTIEMVMYEGALAGSGTTPIDFRTRLEGPLPTGGAQPFLAGVLITPHPADVCGWSAAFSQSAFEVSATRHSSLFPPKTEVTLKVIADPAWHYDILCPGVTEPLRLPRAPVERSVTGWFGLILPPGRAGPQGITIEIPAYNGSPSCLYNRGVVSASNQFGTLRITVDIVDPPCSPPPPQP